MAVMGGSGVDIAGIIGVDMTGIIGVSEPVRDFVTRAGYGSESEPDDEASTITLSCDLGRVNRASNKSAVRLQEIGPRMKLRLIKIEEGLCDGGTIFSEYESEKNAQNQENENDDEGDKEGDDNEEGVDDEEGEDDDS